MQIEINIVGLRYYALAGNRWQQLFNADGRINDCYSGTKILLRRSCENAVDSAVEALSGGERWGNVADSEKYMLNAYMKSRGLEQITTTIVAGDRDMHGLQVKADIDPAANCAEGKDFTAYKQWLTRAEAFPVLMPTADEQLFSTTLASLDALAASGRWNHELFCQLQPLIGIDLSGDASRDLRRLLMRARNIGEAVSSGDAHRLECDMVHLGSTENRLKWLSHWRAQISSPQMEMLWALAQYVDMSGLEALLLSFPDNVFALISASPVLAVARLHYARLPREIMRKFISLWLLWEYGQQKVEEKQDAEVSERPDQLTAQQAAIFAYYLLDNQGTLNCTSRQTIADFFSLLTGYKSKTLRQRLDFQSRFDNPRVRSDIQRVASLIRTLMPSIYAKFQNELAVS